MLLSHSGKWVDIFMRLRIETSVRFQLRTFLPLKFIPQALFEEDWQDGEPTEAEKDFWELASLECYDHLTDWKSLEYCATFNIDSGKPSDLSKTWDDPFFQVFRNHFVDTTLFLSLQGCPTVM